MSLILNNKTARLMLVSKSHRAFFATYFGHYVRYPSAPIHQQLFDLTEDANAAFGLAVTFRGSAKSTICSMSYPIWSVLGGQKKHFVLLVSKTLEQSKKLLDSIKREFETNTRLQADFGRVHEESTPWNSYALTFERFDAQIAAISIEQSMRGIRFRHYRPDVFILDDIEDTASVHTKESRDKLEDWLVTDLLPAGDKGTRTIFVGNNLHQDSLPNRIADKVRAGLFDATVITCPLVDANGVCAWPGKFPDDASIGALKNSFPSTKTWRQEYQLEIVPPDEQIIFPDDIHYYDDLPRTRQASFMAVGGDLASSLNPKADKTAFVPALVTGNATEQCFHILQGIVNDQMDFGGTQSTCLNLVRSIGNISNVRVFAESVAYQKVFVQELRQARVPYAEEYIPWNKSKRHRVYAISAMIKSGRNKFTRYGAEELIDQLVYFGATRYDDLADALTTLVLSVQKQNRIPRDVGVLTEDISPENLARIAREVAAAQAAEVVVEQFQEYRDALGEQYDKMGVDRKYMPF